MERKRHVSLVKQLEQQASLEKEGMGAVLTC